MSSKLDRHAKNKPEMLMKLYDLQGYVILTMVHVATSWEEDSGSKRTSSHELPSSETAKTGLLLSCSFFPFQLHDIQNYHF